MIRQGLKDTASRFSWQEEDIQSPEDHRQKAFFVPDKNMAATQTLLFQCSLLAGVRVYYAAQFHALSAGAILERKAE